VTEGEYDVALVDLRCAGDPSPFDLLAQIRGLDPTLPIVVMAAWGEELGEQQEEWRRRAAQASDSFHARFWYEAGGYLFDVIDGEGEDDASVRPNQILTLSLRFPILARARWRPSRGNRPSHTRTERRRVRRPAPR